jgi:hypothetical protein
MHMSDTTTEQDRLSADLAQLRAALRGVAAPPAAESAIRAAFRAARHVQPRPVARGRRRFVRRALGAAAAVVLALAATLGLVLLDANGPALPEQVRVPASAEYIVPAFQPLQNAPGLNPAGSYSVVRVRIPLSSLALVPGTEHAGTVEAELLVGEDGLARGIRFMQADALLVSAQR